MERHTRAILMGLALTLAAGGGTAPARAADSETVDAATRQVESGAKKTGEGVGDTARAIGETVVEGTKVAGNTLADAAKTTGKTLGEAGKAVGRGAKSAWETVRDTLIDFGDDVVSFFKRGL